MIPKHWFCSDISKTQTKIFIFLSQINFLKTHQLRHYVKFFWNVPMNDFEEEAI